MSTPKVGLRKIRRKNKFVYQIDYTIDGKRKREAVGSNKSQALLYQAKIQTDIMNGVLKIKQKDKISFPKLISEYFQIHRNSISKGTQKKYDGFVKDFEYFFKKYFKNSFEDITLINTAYIVESQNHFVEKGARSGSFWSHSLCNSYKTFLAMIFNFAIEKSYIDKNPASSVPSRRVELDRDFHFYSDKEIDSIFSLLPHNWVVFFSFLLNTGLRLGECLNLTWDRVKIDDDIPKVIIASDDEWKLKTKNSRKVPLNDVAKNIVISQKGKSTKYVFSENGEKIEKNKPLRELKKVLTKLKLKGDVHQFRHTFATNFISKNKRDNSIYDLGKVLGHSDTKTTLIYAHLSEEHLHKSVSRAEKRIT